MRGLPELNSPAFHAGAAKLRNAGHEVFNPADQISGDVRRCLGADLAWITGNAEAVALLSGWEQSLGAQAERATALAIGIPAKPIADFLE
jgi:hypothetical protein